jgi:hypothetical protein
MSEDLSVYGPRVRCERYGADISASTCIARQKLVAHARWGRTGGGYPDPGCADCAQGKAAAAGNSGAPAPAPAKMKQKKAEEKKMAEMTGTKVCNRCGETKAAGEFYPMPNNKSGRDNSCKKCRNKATWAATKARKAALKAKADAVINALPKAAPPAPEDPPKVEWGGITADHIRTAPGAGPRPVVTITVELDGIEPLLRFLESIIHD